MFTELQLIIIPIILSFICPLVSYFLFRYGRKALTQSFEDKMELWYSYTAAGILGKFLFFSLPNATGPQYGMQGAFVSGFVMIGFFVMLCIQKFNRFWNDNPHYVGPSTCSIEIRNLVDKDTLEIKEYFSADKLNDLETANERFQLLDEKAELKKRRLIFYLTLVVMILTVIFEGFILIFREPLVFGGSWVAVSFFVVDKIKETAIISIVALHAFIHTDKKLFGGIFLGWTLCVVASCIPMMAKLSWEDAFTVVMHLATQVFYSLSGGVLFWIALYFVWMDKQKTDKCETTSRLVVFGVSASVSWVCGVFI